MTNPFIFFRHVKLPPLLDVGELKQLSPTPEAYCLQRVLFSTHSYHQHEASNVETCDTDCSVRNSLLEGQASQTSFSGYLWSFHFHDVGVPRGGACLENGLPLKPSSVSWFLLILNLLFCHFCETLLILTLNSPFSFNQNSLLIWTQLGTNSTHVDRFILDSLWGDMEIRFLSILFLKPPTFRFVKCQEKKVPINSLHSRTHMKHLTLSVSSCKWTYVRHSGT